MVSDNPLHICNEHQPTAGWPEKKAQKSHKRKTERN